ncbi:hypothetical protein ATO7_02815 [Oceanococcus atlanticus]|uniref:Uncharacterized protein n=1 Tax=Oceanococcus atlanticus TaxID=1317117 RepID=A0A1Y1SGI3_9GAMM|nr:hypothetical protein [Oceanococcus atlanticus]ORE88772.1 hypothetical protein ATO7_02815 [Oceanococcus atlanticus]
MPKIKYDPKVYEGKIATMRHMLHAVSHGYHHWTGGRVPAAKALNLAAKFAELYGVDLGRNRRYRRRAASKANAQLFFYPIADSQDLAWWLLATDGEGNVHRQENLKDTRIKHQRLNWLGEYEVAHHSRPETPKPSYSWRMTAKTYDNWKIRLKHAGSSADTSLMRQAVWSLYRTPGAAVIRKQVGHLMALAKKEWNRHHDIAAFPPVPGTLLYMSHRQDDVQPLSMLVARVAKGRKSWFGGRRRVSTG